LETLIRNALVSDLPQIIDIRNYYILNTKALFETEPSSFQERLAWFNRYKYQGPHQIWVAEVDDRIFGYAFSSPYRIGAYFDRTVETSIYLSPDATGRGIGSQLYSKVFEDIKNENLISAVAGIALPNEASIALHKKFGFEEVGVFKNYAEKNGTPISSLWLQKMF
jgi:phosphinothricin acetyltransferase